jgi:imidazole glycerol phosphate synthase subunit HisF
MWQAFHLAQEVGQGLGAGEILLGTMQTELNLKSVFIIQ